MGLDPTPRNRVLSVMNMHAQVCSFSRTSKQRGSRIRLRPNHVKSSNEPVGLGCGILCCPVSCAQAFANADIAVNICTEPKAPLQHLDISYVSH